VTLAVACIMPGVAWVEYVQCTSADRHEAMMTRSKDIVMLGVAWF
jgi:hypothetical protein